MLFMEIFWVDVVTNSTPQSGYINLFNSTENSIGIRDLCQEILGLPTFLLSSGILSLYASFMPCFACVLLVGALFVRMKERVFLFIQGRAKDKLIILAD